MRTDLVPALAGVLGAGEVAATAAAIAAMQEPSGAIPWTTGEHTDIWNHVEAAMAMVVGGEVAAAERAYRWAARMQRPDGSWPMRIVDGVVEDASGNTNMSAYLAVGIWHHWLVRRDRAFVEEFWPVVRSGLDFVVGLQLPFGGIAWTQEWSGGRPAEVVGEALLTGSSSIHQALQAGVALADLMADPQPTWELAGGRLAHAVRQHRDRFLDKSTYSMDWYYPVLGGAVRGDAARTLLAGRWEEFVRPGLGVRCVDTDPWVTGAETCELALALDALGDRETAVRLVAEIQRLREPDGRYWTGLVYPELVFWPGEHTTYTAAAVVLAVDALSDTTPGAGIMRSLRSFDELGLQCGCRSVDRIAGATPDPA